ncbi:histidine phosphatase family protein [Dongia sp.]|uniref:histidine phosphatase family protein n=1 Tax=Dongia sp. TaxID=1977262 RepID=UPI0035AEFD49
MSFSYPFYFLRHGETDWNLARRVMGQTDIPLNETGLWQARRAADLLHGEAIAAIWSSPLQRCKATAELVAAKLSLPVSIADGLSERHWGIYQGGPQDRRPLRAKAPEGGETLADFAQRTLAAFGDATATGPSLIVAHSGSFRVLIRALGLTDADAPVANARPLRIEGPGRITPLGTD